MNQASLREAAKGTGVVKSKRKITQRCCKPRSALRIVAHSPLLQECCSCRVFERVEFNLDGLTAPIRPTRRHYYTRARDGKQVAQRTRGLDIVINEEVRQTQSSRNMRQTGACRAFLIWLTDQALIEPDGKRRKTGD